MCAYFDTHTSTGKRAVSFEKRNSTCFLIFYLYKILIEFLKNEIVYYFTNVYLIYCSIFTFHKVAFIHPESYSMCIQHIKNEIHNHTHGGLK